MLTRKRIWRNTAQIPIISLSLELLVDGILAGVDPLGNQIVPGDFEQRKIVGQQQECDRDEVVPFARQAQDQQLNGN